MRVTHVMFGFNTGGAELMVADIMAEQAKAGHDITLLIINDNYEQHLLDALSESVRVVKVGRPEGSHNPTWYLRYNLMLRRTHPDIVHFHQVKGAYFTIKPRGAKMVHTVHDTSIARRPSPKLDRVFAISQAVSDDLHERHNLPSVIVHNGIACSRLNQKLSPTCSSPLRLVNVARLMHNKKGQDIAIEALPLLAARGIDATLDLIGEGESEQYLRDLAKERGVADKVNFLGNRTRTYIYSALARYDIFVLPSRFEGFGLTVAEAMAAKLPVVVSDIEGPMEIIDGGRYGVPFATGDPQALADAVAEVAARYRDYQSIAAKEAYRHVTERYGIDRTAKEYLVEYKKIING